MTRDQLLFALQNVPESYLAETDALLWGAGVPTVRRPLRRVMIAAAVAAALLLAAFTVAMAANDGFRERVYRVFHIETPERVPAPAKLPKDADDIVQFDHASLEEVADIDYYSVSMQLFRMPDGTVYGGDPEHRCLYRFSGDGVETLQTTHREIALPFHGQTFHIVYDYARGKEGWQGDYRLGWLEDSRMDENPEGFVIRLTIADPQSGKAWLELPDWDAHFAPYPMLLDLERGEVTDVLAGMDASVPEDAFPILWSYSQDQRYMLQADLNEMHSWLYDLQTRTRTDVSELLGIRGRVTAFFDGADTLIGVEHTETTLRTVRCSLSTGEKHVLDLSEYAGRFGEGNYALTADLFSPRYFVFMNEDGTRSILNIRTGEVIDRPDEKLGDPGMAANLYASPDGSRIAFVSYEQEPLDGVMKNVFRQLAVLDVETGVYTVLDREREEAVSENAYGWIDNNSFLLLTEPENGRQNVSVYTLHAPA